MNRKFIVFLVFLIFISIAGVSAVSDVNQTDSDLNLEMSDSEYGYLFQEDSVSTVSDTNQTDSDSTFSRLDSECCSFVIQEDDETVFAFRQDAALNGRGVVIHNDTINGMDVIIQEIDTPSNHFIHAIITEDGWVASHGGDSSNVSHTIALENIAIGMLTSKTISNESISQIQDIFKIYNYGHFLIKAPDGRYAVAYSDACIFGTLKQGEFLVIANTHAGFRKGNYTDYGMDPVDAIVEICSYENSGFNRRNLYSYDYKAHRTANGQKYGVDIYVTNDNGHNVGLNTSEIVCYCYFNDARYQQSAIPENPDKMQIATYIFENQVINSTIQVVPGPDIVYVEHTSPVRYVINNIVDERTVVFDLDGENAEFVDAVVFEGNYSIDSAKHKLYWDLPATNTSKEIILSVMPKDKGFYKIIAHIEGIDEEVEVTRYATTKVAIFNVEEVTTYKSYYTSMKVYLTDDEGVPYIGEKVSFTIDGKTYSRKVTPYGYAALAIMLQPGEYDVRISYALDFFSNHTTSKIIVNNTLICDNMIMLHGDQVAYYVYALDENGSALFKGSEVDFFIDGDLWDKYVDDEGKCFINVTRLDPGIGNFSVIIYNIRTNEIVTKWIDILEPTELAVNATTATYNIDKDMVISLYDINGNTLSGVNLSVDLGGVKTYTTDENGQVKINVANIVPKTYTAEITFEGNDKYAPAAANTTVTVNKAKAKIVAKNKSFKAKTKTKTYAIVLKDNKGKAIKKAKVTIKLKGKTYTAKTDSNGKATFKITGLAKKGTYKATVKFAANKYYNAVNKKVKITVK